jgi:hypothetical protein
MPHVDIPKTYHFENYLILTHKPCISQIYLYVRGGRPQNNRNLNVARELKVVARCAARCRESSQYSSSMTPRSRLLEYCVDSRHLAAHRATNSSSRATFKFLLFLDLSSCMYLCRLEVGYFIIMFWHTDVTASKQYLRQNHQFHPIINLVNYPDRLLYLRRCSSSCDNVKLTSLFKTDIPLS